ncbi:metal ABC transporter substrate-binding protein [Spirochaeta lutea]|uniref:metal ABC transporter substrate-binding protein n=1 Tax=Spirochaeta lutea TaxID=1480694 RepID=UPI00068B1B11|nr:metal ABC transporter substrate-binding protein [Spirochaeta lutea]
MIHINRRKRLHRDNTETRRSYSSTSRKTGQTARDAWAGKGICIVRGFLTVMLLFLVSQGLLWAGSQGESPSHAQETGTASHPEPGQLNPDSLDELLSRLDVISGSAKDLPVQNTRLSVVASTTILGDVVRQVAGEAADVHVIMPLGQNPHSYEPTPRELARISNAHVVFVNGFGLEEQLETLIQGVTPGPVVSVSSWINALETEDDHDREDDGEHQGEENDHEDTPDQDADDHHGVDPHVWFSPRNVMSWVDVIREVLIAADPARAQQYRNNARIYREKLAALDQEILNAIEGIPRERRLLVTGHDLFGYFARDYGFQVVGAIIPSVSDQAEPSPRLLSELVHLLEDSQVPAIFVGGTESQALQNLAQALSKETQGTVRVMPTLTGSLSPPGQPGDSYLSYVRYNIAQIVQGLR